MSAPASLQWLLLRGLTREAAHWAEFPSAIKSERPQDVIHCLDLPGAGTEHGRGSPASVSGIVDDLRERWRSLHGDARLPSAILGMSLGGMVTLDWASRFPRDFQYAVVINSSASNLSQPLHRIHLKNWPKLLEVFMASDTAKREKLILQMTTRMQKDLNNLAENWGEIAEKHPMTSDAILGQMIAGFRFKAPETMKVPLLVLAAKEDNFVNWQCSEQIAKYYGCSIETHPRAGHDLTLDDPSWCASRISEWLKKSPTAIFP